MPVGRIGWRLHSPGPGSKLSIQMLCLLDRYDCPDFKVALVNRMKEDLLFWSSKADLDKEYELRFTSESSFLEWHYKPVTDAYGRRYPSDFYEAFAQVYLMLAERDKDVTTIALKIDSDPALATFIAYAYHKKLLSMIKAVKYITENTALMATLDIPEETDEDEEGDTDL
jgi:hypothetical protein